ncbi:helix-turn-helix transcriptional regulator [Fictibacillus barbaricus]|uniref:Helix-turn-helix transcriptional regulator n=1 Tax=Fictibacillus barbaricus TaxID=182136 RepID=A0ABS2ZEJ4_9BACL|nr:helix-turn-helix transcriptional regulator [Fictibacillus barbaricus]MBN3546595.1 helix-turn-helix transcriptional regulator [Fictibacillus barbaricus]GGB42262.1 transcriptional regulator [Fictibacillus barbaricus]
MNLGERIRYFRRVKNLSQQELASGICSVPYLSKIENGVTEPSEEIQQHLANRLQIGLGPVNEKEILQRYVNLFQQLYLRDYKLAEQKFKLLTKSPFQYVDEDIYHKIFKSIYLLMAKQETREAQVLLDEVAYIGNVIRGEKGFYYFIARGLLSYYKKEYKGAFGYLLEAETRLEHNRFQEWEKGYLLYLIGLTANQLYKNIVALEYTNKALEIFDKTYIFKRSADCRILLGIIYLRIKNLEEATNQFGLAETIANAFDDDLLRGAIYQNLGIIATKKDDSETAIQLFAMSLQAKRNQPNSFKLSTIVTLAKEYEKTNRPKQGLALIEEGLNLTEQNPLYRGYELHFMYYKHVFAPENNEEEKIHFMVHELIPYFEQRNEWIHLTEYYPIIGKYYESHQKYKNASKYYYLTIEALKKMYEMGVTYA